MTNRFPLHRPRHKRTWLIGRDARCTRCGLPACIRLGLGSDGQRYCTGCAVKFVRQRKEAHQQQRQHSYQLASKQDSLLS
jgi:uncharacterized Zn finger protein (UPF0148 family)